MNQNDILRRVRYILDLDDSKMMSIFALNLRAEETLAILALNDFNISKHELSAFFRKPGHKHFRACKDQVLRNFLKGLQLKYRGNIWSGSSS